MRRSRWTILPAKVEQIRDQLNDWRRTRQKRSPIPESIWQAAAALAAEHGLHRVAKALRLNYPDLKRRTEAMTSGGPPLKKAASVAESISPAAKNPASAFVALDWDPGLVAAPCVVEIENRAGMKMKISLRQPGGAELAALVAAFGSHTG